MWFMEVQESRVILEDVDCLLSPRIQGDQGDRWFRAQVDIPSIVEHYDFIFEGVVVRSLSTFFHHSQPHFPSYIVGQWPRIGHRAR